MQHINRSKDKNPLDRHRKGLWHNSTSFMIKISEETRIKRNVPPHNKRYIWQTYSQHYTKWIVTETIPATVRNETGVPDFPTPIQCSLEFLARAIK
jgi:hypothetical protein